MARRYRKDDNEGAGLVIMYIVASIIGFITKYWEAILMIVVGFSIILLVIYFCIKHKKNKSEKDNSVKKIPFSFSLRKLQKRGRLYSEIIELNENYQLEELRPLYFTYNVRSRKGLREAYIDDYLLMAIDREESKIEWYIDKYHKLLNTYVSYQKEYDKLWDFVTDEEANRLGMSKEKYEKNQRYLYDNMRKRSRYNFSLIVYLNYSSEKGRVKESSYKKYNKEEYYKLYQQYLNMKETKSLYQINSRIERQKMNNSIRHDVFKRDNYRCCICGKSARDGVRLEVDHIIPVSKGGKTEMDNLQTLCERCNNGKRNKI